ncbi:MAG: LytTR family DNA-binding domain-containing protein [Bacteroidota bacterium]
MWSPGKALVLPGPTSYTEPKPQRIGYVEVLGKWCLIHFKSGDPLRWFIPLNYIEQRVDPQLFCRIHHHYLVNKEFVKSYHLFKYNFEAYLGDGNQIPGSSRKQSDFLAMAQGFPHLARR